MSTSIYNSHLGWCYKGHKEQGWWCNMDKEVHSTIVYAQLRMEHDKNAKFEYSCSNSKLQGIK